MEYLKPLILNKSLPPEEQIKVLENYIFEMHRIINYSLSELDKIQREREENRNAN